MTKKKILLSIIVLLFFFWDGHLSTLISSYLVSQFFITSHLFLMVVCMLSLGFSIKYDWVYLLGFGFLYDSYYLKSIGIVLITLPLLQIGLRKFGKVIHRNAVVDILLFFLFLVAFDFFNYCLAFLYGVTQYPLIDYILYQLSPTLVFNTILFLFLKGGFLRLIDYIWVDRIK